MSLSFRASACPSTNTTTPRVSWAFFPLTVVFPCRVAMPSNAGFEPSIQAFGHQRLMLTNPSLSPWLMVWTGRFTRVRLNRPGLI